MPKRPNPFGEYSPLQVKTHVGTKEVDLGVNQHENMQTVYDKTKDLLFEGSRKACHPCQTGLDTEWNDSGRAALSTQPIQGQLCIDSDGSLCGATASQHGSQTAGFQFSMPLATSILPSQSKCESMDMDDMPLNNNTLVMPYPPPPGQMTLDSQGKLCQRPKASAPSSRLANECYVCQSCNHPSNTRARTCSFCDKITCSSCLQLCSNCEGLFCRVCSTTNYDHHIERILCLHCSG